MNKLMFVLVLAQYGEIGICLIATPHLSCGNEEEYQAIRYSETFIKKKTKKKTPRP